jgi:putative oxidoreductase
MNTLHVDPLALAASLLLLRLVLGLTLAAHGAQKLFGWFGGHGLSGTGGFFESMGFRPGRVFALAAGLGELVGGLLVALGLLGPVGPALLIAVMVVAVITVHAKNGFFNTAGGYEFPLLIATASAALALAGPGQLSVDRALGLDAVWTPAFAVVAIIVGVAGGLANLALRHTAPPSDSRAAAAR